jgi:hypothetical protein
MMNFSTHVLGGALLLAGAVSAQTDTINVLRPYEQTQGFELLFDGVDAGSFRNRFVNYVRNSTTNTTLHAGWTTDLTQTDPDRPGAVFGSIINGNANLDTRSRQIYRDFDLRFDYRNSGNQGFIYRFDVTGAYSWETGIELAIDNNITQSNEKFEAGGAYDLFAPSTQAYHLRNTNKWNSVRVVAKGDSVEHWMNGVKVVSFRYWSPEFLTAYQASKWTGFSRFCQTAPNNRTYIPQGYIGFQGDHGGAWQIRRLRILHDSSSATNRVKLGAVDTTNVSGLLSPAPGAKHAAFKFRTQGGRLNVASDEAAIRSVEIRAFDGRLAARSEAARGSLNHDMDVSRLRHGLYLVRVESESGLHQARTLIP